MPLSSVLGASSVIRPGVCTSTTRPTVPYTGQLIFETDTSRLAVWTGSAWQYESAAAGPPGLVYITGASFSAVSSFSLPNNTFTSTYTNYLVQWDFSASTSAGLIVRMRASGTDNTTSSYNSNGAWWGNGGSSGNFGVNGGTSFTWSGAAAGAVGRRNTTVFTLFGPQATQNTGFTATGSGGNSAGSEVGGYMLGGDFQNTTSFDAISVIVASGNITGTYRVYGYTNS